MIQAYAWESRTFTCTHKPPHIQMYGLFNTSWNGAQDKY